MTDHEWDIEETIEFLQSQGYVVHKQDKVAILYNTRFVDDLEMSLKHEVVDLEEFVRRYSAAAFADELLRVRAITWDQSHLPDRGLTEYHAKLTVILP
jgi:hypothetical protein